jgi:hypothetical protein
MCRWNGRENLIVFGYNIMSKLVKPFMASKLLNMALNSGNPSLICRRGGVFVFRFKRYHMFYFS